MQGLYTIAPTVTRSGLRDATGRDRDPSVAGSSGPENNYILDGVNTTDPAFGGSGANLPFEFVQEVEIKTGAYGPEYGKSTGGIFNVITKSGGNEFHGDIFGYGTTKGLVREVKNFPFTGSAFNGFSEVDVGGDIGGPIVKDKLWFFGAFNPQKRKNYYLTQTFHTPVRERCNDSVLRRQDHLGDQSAEHLHGLDLRRFHKDRWIPGHLRPEQCQRFWRRHHGFRRTPGNRWTQLRIPSQLNDHEHVHR